MASSATVRTGPPRKGLGPRDKDLALKLLIELLSYQLASPVRWIETQQELFSSQPSVRKFVEIGPRTILATMAKKSASIHTKAHPSRTFNEIEILSYPDNHAQISYQYPEAYFEKPSLRFASSDSTVKTARAPSADDPKQYLPQSRDLDVKATPSTEAVLTASHIVLAMTSQKLRRRFDRVSVEKSIRDLSRGKSTFQNELTGDLVVEFGRVPEGVEDQPLANLGQTLQSDFSGSPGRSMSLLISRLISGKMPAGFNQGAMQEYLKSRWGLSNSHSLVPICFATTMEPASRLSTTAEACSYLDDLVSKYAAFQGISLVPVTENSEGNHAPTTGTVDSACFDGLNQKLEKLYCAQARSLAAFLEIGSPTSKNYLPESEFEARMSNLEEMIGLLSAELDEQFIQGIKPIFSIAQSREYDSWWNWCREDIIRLVIEISQNPSSVCQPRMGTRLQRLLNRWHPSCADIVRARLDYLHTSLAAPVMIIEPIFDEIISLGTQALAIDPLFVYTLPGLEPQTMITAAGQLEYREVPRQTDYYPDAVRYLPRFDDLHTKGPFVHIKTRHETEDWKFDPNATSLYHTMLDIGATTGFTYANKAVLVTGAGPGSIAIEIIKGLLSGGARVVVTTSRPMSETAAFYQRIYRKYGARNSSLTILPLNQASKQDCEALVRHLYGPGSPTGGGLDYMIPFAAMPQAGEPDVLNGRQELALRAMLVNLLRLIGFVRRKKERLRIETRPTMVVLPMSCNEGTFGGDGLYSESKIGLKALFNRFYSESWSKYLTICGAVIGWTRGTTIMQSHNTAAEEVEKLGLMTFTQSEMAFNILALMTPALTALAEDAPIYADLTGGLGSLWNIKKQIAAARKRISDKQRLAVAIAEEDSRQEAMVGNMVSPTPEYLKVKTRLARLRLPFPQLRDLDASFPDLEGMIDLSRVAVVVGYSELGPWGNARTRWEIEHQGEFSLEGYIEMAWIMGLIQHVDGHVKGEPYVGWVDTDTQIPVPDDQVPEKYHNHIMAHCGLRLIKPESKESYDPSRRELLHEVAVEEDLPPFEASKSIAEAFKLRQDDYVTLEPIPNSDNYRVHVMKGAILMIPKTVPFDQVVAGKIPDGWDPTRYGIPEDIVQQVDVTTLYALCCVSEAFLSAGIKDPYEIYQHIHVSEVGNCLGSGGGPMKVIQNMYRDRFLDRQLRGDIILEHFVNTMGAWVNMLLLSATGPLKTPVGACATALESLDIGCEGIQTGKFKMAIVGGCDDYGEELAYEFASIKATANSTKEVSNGRNPAEISRPTTSSRSGFAESAGCGVQILMSAELALQMGLPIYGIIAYTQMASDQISRSIPAPGKGILTTARETTQAISSPLLDMRFRRKAFDQEIAGLSTCQDSLNMKTGAPGSRGGYAASLKVRDAQRRWGNDIRMVEPSISPIRASLATWGLTIDDVNVISMHGTSTKANELNEGDVINTQMEHLGRRTGNPLLCVCQKWLTGHPKAAAGAWQLNGCLQMMRESIVPGNRNADNIDKDLQQFKHLVYPMESLHVSEVKATLLTSFGFGQKGAINITVSPKYLFAALSATEYQGYRDRVTKRQRSAIPHFIARLIKNEIVQVKSQPPWNNPEAMRDFFLDPTSRVVDGQVTHTAQTECTIQQSLCSEGDVPIAAVVQTMLESLNRPSSATTAVGVDIEDISNLKIDNSAFIDRNFTDSEREYCFGASDPRASFAGRWSAKEAVFKSLQTASAGAGAAMREIEILSVNGIPKVVLRGHAQEVAASTGITQIEVTISHCNQTAIAVALATRKYSTDSIGKDSGPR